MNASYINWEESCDWEELCDWARRLHNNRIRVEEDEMLDKKVILIYAVDSSYTYIGLVIKEGGYIYSGRACIAVNCTPHQIKTIIKIVLNQNVKIKSQKRKKLVLNSNL